MTVAVVAVTATAAAIGAIAVVTTTVAITAASAVAVVTTTVAIAAIAAIAVITARVAIAVIAIAVMILDLLSLVRLGFNGIGFVDHRRAVKFHGEADKEKKCKKFRKNAVHIELHSLK